MSILWLHVNTYVDGCHAISFYGDRDTAYTRMKEFIGHDDYKRGDNVLKSDDGDISLISPVHFEDDQRLEWEIESYTSNAPFVWVKINGTAAEALALWAEQEKETSSKLRLRLIEPTKTMIMVGF